MYVVIQEQVGAFAIQQQVVLVVRVSDFSIPSGITNTFFTQKGGILIGTGPSAFVEFPPGSNGQVLIYDSTQPSGVGVATLESVLPKGYINGLTLSNNVSDATNDIDVAVGVVRDDANVYNMALTTPITKRLDATFTAGNGGGGLDTGAKANSTWYHLFLIRKNSNGEIDALFSTSFASPTMPSGYSYKRRIGAVRTNGSGALISFLQDGSEFIWVSPPFLDVDVNNLGTSRTNYTLSGIPSGLRLKFRANVTVGSASANSLVYISNPDLTDLAPVENAVPLTTLRNFVASVLADTLLVLYSNASAQISARADGASRTFRVSVLSWVDPRGQW